MIKNRVLRGLACFVLIGATVGLYFGANAFSEMSGVRDREEQAGGAGSLQGNGPDAGESNAEDAGTTGQEIEGWARPETEPAADDLYGRLQVGDFSVLNETALATSAELEAAFSKERGHSIYSIMDVNADGRDELLWQIFRENKTDARVLAVFSQTTPDSANLFIWDPLENENEYYLAGTDSLLYIRKNIWLISELHVTKVIFDLTGEEYAGDGISLYLVEDEAAYKEQVDPALQKRMSFITGVGVWYQRVPCGKTVEDAPVIGKQEYDTLFTEMTGLTLADVSPRAEIKRNVASTSLTGEADVHRRVRYNTQAFDVRISYPQLLGGDKAEIINQAFFSAAYEMVVSEDNTHTKETEETNHPANAETDMPARIRSLQSDYGKELTANVSCLILDDAQDYVSVLFARDGKRLLLDTFDRASGRQVQLGDVAAVSDVEKAIRSAQCAVFRWEEGHLVKDVALSKDQDFQEKEFAATSSGNAAWKNIGVDEQYIYIVLHAESEGEVLLRVPLWTIGVSSAGHMQLLTMHKAYPFLKSVLDTATQVRVRKNREGFEIKYVAASGSPVTMYLTKDDNPPRPDMTASESRDYFAAMYEDGMTAYQTGLLLADNEPAEKKNPEGEIESDGENETGGERLLNYYAIEEGFGAAGHVFFEAHGEAYRLDYSGRMAQGFPTLTEDTPLDGMIYKPAGTMTKSSLNYETWHDFTDDSLRLEYMVAEDNGEEEPLLYVFRLVNEMQTDEDGREKEVIALSVYPKDNPWREVRFAVDADERIITFRDLNGDSYPDITLGTVRANDHTDERNFLYDPRTGGYVRGPAELEEKNMYKVYAEAGFVIVTEADYTKGTRLIRYDFNQNGSQTGALTRMSTLTTERAGAGEQEGSVSVLLTDDTLMQEEAPPVLDLQADDEKLSVITDFFMRKTVWESGMDGIPAEGLSQEEDASLRMILAANVLENHVASSEQTYLYVVSGDGKRLERKAVGEALRVEHVETVGADYAGRFYLQEEENEQADGPDAERAAQKILIFFEKEADDETDPNAEREPDESIDVPELMKELGFLK